MIRRFVVVLLAACLSNAVVVIELFPNLSPIDAKIALDPNHPDDITHLVSPSYAAYANNVLTGLRTGQTQVGGSQAVDPKAFNNIGPSIAPNGVGSVNIGVFDFMGSTDFYSWRGQLNPAGAFGGEYGTHLRIAVRFTDSTAFRAGDVQVTDVYPDFPDTEPFPFGLLYPLGSDRLAGLYWGADGIQSTADDVLYDMGNPGDETSLINQLFFIGFGNIGFETLGPCALPGDDLLALEDWNNCFGQGYRFSETYSLRGVTSTVNVNVTPEPGTMTLVALGLSVLTFAARRNKK